MDFQVYLVRQGLKSRGGSRLLRILEHGISLVALAVSNPVAAEYSFEHIAKVTASNDDPTELSMEILDTTKQSHGYDTLRLSCDSRSALLTVLLNRIDEVNGIGTDFSLKKHSNQRGGLVDTVLRVRSASIVKMVNIGHRQERRRVHTVKPKIGDVTYLVNMKGAKKVNFKDIVKLETLSDDEHIVLVYLASRVMRLSLKDSLPFLLAVQRNMKTNLKQDIEIQKITSSAMIENVAAYLRKGKESPVLYQFEVMKRQDITKQERPRIVCMTKNHLIEKWADHVTGVHSLNDILGLIVNEKDTREVTVEFRSWRSTQYFLDDRDNFLATMAELMGIGKGTEFSIRLEPYFPHTLPDKLPAAYQSECEAYFLNRFIGTFNSIRDPAALHVALKEYACNIHVGDSQCSDFKILQAVTDTLKECVGVPGQDSVRATTCCIVLQRLLASRTCFEAVKSMPDVVAVLFQCMRSENNVLSYLATVAVRAAIKFAAEPGSVEIGIATKQEFANRLAVLSADYLQQLVALLHTHSLAKNSSLQVVGLLDTLTLALTSQPSDNEAGRMWFKAYEASIMAAADVLCSICRSPSSVVFNSNAVLLRTLLTKTSAPVCTHLQRFCLGRCVLLVHLKTALSSKQEHVRLLSGNLVYLMMEGNRDARKLLEAFLPKGVMQLYASKVVELKLTGKEKTYGNFPAWMETLEVLRLETLETPVLVWNDVKRMELKKFLQDEVEGFYEASASDRELFYNSADVQLVYSTASEGDGSVIGGVHLELLVDHSPPADSVSNSFWKLHEPLAIFQSVFQAMVLGFTPLFGHNNLPELDLRLAVHVLTWIYERHAEEVAFCLETLNVVETAVGMLREVVESEHQVFVFKLVVFLLAAVEKGGRDNVLRFIRSGGATVLVPLVVLSLAKCCTDKHEFECDAWSSKDSMSWGAVETLQYVGADGEVRLVRIPSGRAHELLERAAQDGSMDAKEAIRWQDEKVPEKIQLGLALDLLEALLRYTGLAWDVSRLSGGDSNIIHYPPSAACFNFSREEIFCHLVQSLLLAKTPIFNRILEIVTTLTNASRIAMSHLYKFGAFEILLWKLLDGDVVEWDKTRIAKFLSQCHLLQDPSSLSRESRSAEDEHGSWRDSALHLYLPEGLILKLISEGPEAFLAQLDSEQDAPEVIWNMEMRNRLLGHLTTELESYVKFRATDPLALYIHVPKAPLAYPELEESVFSAPFYLQNLLDEERFPNYPINDPVGFLNSLMQDLRRSATILTNSVAGTSTWRKELPRTHLLLNAQAHLVDRFPELLLPSDIESVLIMLATPSLRTCLAEKDEAPLVATEVLHHTLRILRRFCAAVTRNDEIPQVSVNFALSVLSLGTRLKSDGSFPEASSNTSLESAVTGSLFVLEITSSSKVGRHCLRDDNRWQEGFFWALCSAAGDALASPPRGPSPASFAALSCLKNFAEDEDFYERVINQALYLPLLLLAIPPPDTALKARDTKSALLYTAADVLGSLVRMLQQTGGSHPSPSQQLERTMMTHLIPGPLLACLEHTEGPDKFMTMAGSDLEQPLVIWTSKVREELHKRVVDRLEQHHVLLATGNGDMGSEVEWLQSFHYDCLKDEISVGGVFVNGLAAGSWEDFGLPAGHAFLDAVLEYLETNIDVLNTGSELIKDDDDDVVGGIHEYLIVLASLRETLKYALKVGRLELIPFCRCSVLSSIAKTGRRMFEVEFELSKIIGILSEDESGRTAVLQSGLLASVGVYLWESAARPCDEGMEDLLMVTLKAIQTLSEGMPATVAATNHFAACGVLLPLLAIFCDVPLPSLHSEYKVDSRDGLHKVAKGGRTVAAQILGQLLLAGSGVSRRSKLVEDLAQRKSNGALNGSANGVLNGSANGHGNHTEGIGEATDMYELINVIESSKKDSNAVQPIVIQTFLRLLPLDLLSTLARDPTEACRRYEDVYHSPRLVWDEGKRCLVKEAVSKEVVKFEASTQQHGTLSILPAWSLGPGQAVFVRWILITILYGDSKAMYRDSEANCYAREMYLGGFFVDQFLRDPGYDFGTTLEARFLCEIRKAVVIGAYADVFNFDDRRRLLLTLLLLFKARPYLLSGQSNIDIFLPVYDFMNNVSERRALAQPAMCLIHAIADHSDIADCIVSDDLVDTLVTFLQLKVPKAAAGSAGTDPRICSLMLLLRLMRLSSATVEIGLRMGMVSKMADFILDAEGSDGVIQRAIECLAIMCADKRKGHEVNRLLDKLVPENAKNYGSWSMDVDHIRDEVVDSETVKHFLKHKYPCEWWEADTLEGISETNAELGPVAVVDASVSFPRATMSDFNDEAEGVFKRSVAVGAQVDTKDVHILAKRPGSVIVDFEVYFQNLRPDLTKGKNHSRRPAVEARLFKEKLEYDSTTFFGGRYFGRMGPPKVTTVAVRHLQRTGNGLQDTWEFDGSFKSIGDESTASNLDDDLGSFSLTQMLAKKQHDALHGNDLDIEPLKALRSVQDFGLFADEPSFRASDPRTTTESSSVSPTSVLTFPSDDHKESPSRNSPATCVSSQPVPTRPSVLSIPKSSTSPSLNLSPSSSPSTIPGLLARPSFNATSRIDSLPPPSPSIAIPPGTTTRPSLPRAPSMSLNRSGVPGLNPPPSPGRISSFNTPPLPSPRPPVTSRMPITTSQVSTPNLSPQVSLGSSPPVPTMQSPPLSSTPRSSSERFPPQNSIAASVPRSASMRDTQPAPVDPSILAKFNNNIIVKFDDGRVMSLGKALAFVLEGADLKTTKRATAIAGFFNAFEEDQEEMGRMIEKYPKLVQTFALQPHLCYDLMCVWEENCLDLLLNDELLRYGKSIAAIDICSVDDVDDAVLEAKKRFQAILKIRKETQAKELRDKPKPTKPDVSADLTNLTSLKKVQDEPRVLPKFKLQSGKKKKGPWS